MAVRGVGRAAALAVLVGVLAACGSAAVSSPPGANAPSAAASSAPAVSEQSDGRCHDSIAMVGTHGAPELEAMLPPTVAGRTLTRWSLAGRCVLETVVQD